MEHIPEAAAFGPHDANRRARLRVLLLGVTGHCNLRCGMCSIWKDPPSRLSPEHLRVVLDDPQVQGHLEYLGITGGEPLLHKGLGDVVIEASRTCRALREVCITTNGSLPDRLAILGAQIAEICALQGQRLVLNLSIDGVGSVHDTQRGVQGAFERALRSLGVAKEIASEHDNVSVTLSAVITGSNASHVMGLLRFAQSQNIPAVLSLPLETDAYYRTDRTDGNWKLLPEQRQELESLFRRLLRTSVITRPEDDLSRLHLEHLLSYLGGGARRARCVFREREGCLVTATGDVFLCGGGEAFRLGHLNDGPPSALLQSGSSAAQIEEREAVCGRCPSVCYLHAVGQD